MKRILAALAAVLIVEGGVSAGPPMDGHAIAERMILAYYYPRDDAKMAVTMRIVNRQGQERKRRLVMLRRDLKDGGEQSYYLHFLAPPDVQGMSFLVFKHVGRDDDRWLYMPALDLVKRISAADRRTSFAGSDFSYEDISGRDIDEDDHAFLREEAIGDRAAFVVKSAAKRPGESEFAYRLFWMDTATFLPLKVEHYSPQGKLYKIYETREIRTIGGTPTITKAMMTDLDNGRFTEIAVGDVSYDVGLSANVFQERSLRRPPASWIR
ncbi:MAG: hypothetical protein A3G34_15910 [Candidatus Lindowbacteria bacterium RIFCSPLOWO2_12_FULL_62_27]|nr:MAG: hypothetical protein A3G34_15910 [Candidatus Lindowbacteria bacterium RIFCSPLOWO2_12_FULL_62_27]